MTTVFIISAPSGSGKSTLVNVVRRTLPNLEFSISYTTRQPRGREKDGCEYFFISREQFEGMIQKNEFLEHAKVFESDYYGTACRFLRHAEQNGNDLLLDIDVQGAEQVKTKIPDAVSVFIMPPNRAELERRLRERSQDSEPVIQKRLKAAGREIENYRKYDYILVNDRLEDSVSTLEAILLSERLKRNERADEKLSARAEKCRLDQIRERIQPILKSFGDTAASGQ
ncbi:MAG: guanylate kinase [Acidobacteria bacterium]|jgi:guanylate kinase|nr:MAG: guanylate kinase [Acidobacteriota bacterium]